MDGKEPPMLVFGDLSCRRVWKAFSPATSVSLKFSVRHLTVDRRSRVGVYTKQTERFTKILKFGCHFPVR